MRIELELFGSLRGFQPGDALALEVAGTTVADLRRALAGAAPESFPGLAPGLIGKCAFATSVELLRDGDALPADGRVSVLPPVSGG